MQRKKMIAFYLRWSIYHAQSSQVTVRDGKQPHEQNGEVIFLKKGSRMFPWLCVTKGKQRKEYNSQEAEEGK